MHTPITTTATATMSHIEIAEIAGKRPDNVKRTMDTLVERGVISVTQIEERLKYTTRTTYHVNQRDSYIVMAQVSPEFTARLVDRWMELETKSKPMSQLEILAASAQALVEHEHKLVMLEETKADKTEVQSLVHRLDELENRNIPVNWSSHRKLYERLGVKVFSEQASKNLVEAIMSPDNKDMITIIHEGIPTRTLIVRNEAYKRALAWVERNQQPRMNANGPSSVMVTCNGMDVCWRKR